jgi:hypothetical protein
MTKISENVFVQIEGEPLYSACERSHNNTRVRHRFLHMVNPFFAPPGSEGDKIQRLTFYTMGLAQSLAPAGTVKHVAVTFPEDQISLPPSFLNLKALQRSVLDIAAFRRARRLPLLSDILASGLAAAEDQDYVVYTNVDICLMPHFYGTVQRILNLGFQSLIINRRTIARYGFDPQLLPLMYADQGQSHPGYDCFVFPRRLIDDFVPSNACVGAPGVMRALIYNLVALSESLLIFRDAHMTFHLGDDKTWDVPELMDYRDHNLRCSQDVLNAHSQEPQRRELLRRFREAYLDNKLAPQGELIADHQSIGS